MRPIATRRSFFFVADLIVLLLSPAVDVRSLARAKKIKHPPVFLFFILIIPFILVIYVFPYSLQSNAPSATTAAAAAVEGTAR